ncbi:MAG: DUF2141 domain-containing protein [Pseudomonadota bacterium]
MLTMKTIGLGLLLSAACSSGLAATVTVRIVAVDSARKGKMMVQLCQKKDFLVRDCKFQNIGDVKSDLEVVVFNNVPDGSWGAMAFHDENGNGKLDTSTIGIPVEGTGFSRNAKGHYGPPEFASASVEVAGKAVEMKFRLNY